MSARTQLEHRGHDASAALALCYAIQIACSTESQARPGSRSIVASKEPVEHGILPILVDPVHPSADCGVAAGHAVYSAKRCGAIEVVAYWMTPSLRVVPVRAPAKL